MNYRTIPAILAAAGLPILAEVGGLWKALSLSHPWWSGSATLKGVLAGLVLGYIALWLVDKGRLSTFANTVISVLVAVVSAAAIWKGRAVFVGSEDFIAWAGQLWHTGFIAFNGSIVLVFSAIFSRFFVGKRL